MSAALALPTFAATNADSAPASALAQGLHPASGMGAEHSLGAASAASGGGAPEGSGSAGGSGALALTSFLLGLTSVVFGWTFFAPIVGLILGTVALRKREGERTLALWGVWLNGIMLALAALAVVAIIAALSIGILALPAFLV